ncbi:nitric oxide synthase oxygenase [Polymorphospora rubra]|uniref:nitric oxide synthase oxygenase n=1 Tax=Polymorphospora rubra TaxID=338584 RepID=UPI0033F0543A
MTVPSRIWSPPPSRRPSRTTPLPDLPAPAAVEEAEAFIRQYHAETPALGPPTDRLAEVRRQIAETGTYEQTGEELRFGARVAWRNSDACIGRLYWRSLQVRDHRTASTGRDVVLACVDHLRAATNGGRIRPVITVFPADRPGQPGPRIISDQLIRYAGHREPDGSVRGDPRNVELTDLARSLGWQPPRPPGRFDILPLIVEPAGGRPMLAELPADAVLEVDIEHPELDTIAALGLRWHAVPAISNMALRIGGITYQAAPFNGWYMGTEIGARNFGDLDRYDMLPAVAELLELDTSAEHTLWRDRALVELNRSVLYSFRKAGVTITDHHTESARFITHLRSEERAGRICPADWSWIVPPMSSSQTPVFHRYYDTAELLPNFLSPTATPVTGCPFSSGTAAVDDAPPPSAAELMASDI